MQRQSEILINHEDYDFKKAKQRASIKWLLSKAYNHKTPDDLKEPFYKDHDNLDRLKPAVIGSFANAELYCLALANLYLDPNLHNLNHWGVLQVLARKGVHVNEPSDSQLTETVLIQTTHFKMNAHMAVTEALMVLFLKEETPGEKVDKVSERITSREVKDSGISHARSSLTEEAALLLWVTKCGEALGNKIKAEIETSSSDKRHEETAVKFPRIQNVSDLSDGLGLCAVISLYCPEELPWSEMAAASSSSSTPTPESLYNIQLLQRFCCGPVFDGFSGVCHLSVEDLVYAHSIFRINIICLLSDLFATLELGVDDADTSIIAMRRGAPIFQRPGMKVTRDKLVIQLPNPDVPLRNNSPSGLKRLSAYGNRELSDDESGRALSIQPGLLTQNTEKAPSGGIGGNNEDKFVVQRGRGVTTLSQVVAAGSVSVGEKLRKELRNQETKSEERGEEGGEGGASGVSRHSNSVADDIFERMKNIPVAGRPSDAPRRPSVYSRNATSGAGVASGGQQQNSNTPIATGGRRSRRNSLNDQMSQLSVENLGGSQDNLSLLGRNPDKEMKTHTGRIMSPNNDDINGSTPQMTLLDNRVLDAMMQMNHNKMQPATTGASNQSPASSDNIMSFADLRRLSEARDKHFHSSGINITYYTDEQEKTDSPKKAQNFGNTSSDGGQGTSNTTTLGSQQQLNNNNKENNSSHDSPAVMAAQLNSVKLKLEQRRKRIEGEKRKMEHIIAKQREKDLGDDLTAVQNRWLSNARSHPEPRTPDIEAMDMDTYTHSLHAMNDSLHDLQSDIQRLAQQHGQIQQMMGRGNNGNVGVPPRPNNPMDPQPFYIAPSDVPQMPTTPQRRTWGQPQPINFAHQGGGITSVDPDVAWDQGGPRRQWGGGSHPAHHPSAMPGNHGYGPAYGVPPFGHNSPYAAHASARDQWGSPVRGQQGDGVYNGGYPDPYSQQGGGYGIQQGEGYRGQQYGGYNQQAPSFNPQFATVHQSDTAGHAAPFRLHGCPQRSPAGGQQQPHQRTSNIGVGHISSSPTLDIPLRRRVSESESNLAAGAPSSAAVPSYSRQLSQNASSREAREGSLEPSHGIVSSPKVSPRKLHTSIPAPAENDMAPQNVSFIESSTEDDPSEHRRSNNNNNNNINSNLSDRLSRLNISSGSKTYRVLSDDSKKSSSPSPTRTRPTISSAFKQIRKGSPGGDPSSGGPSSLRSNSGRQEMTEEELEALATMKMERLKDDTDASKGFVISFDDDVPKKPKPELSKMRRFSSTNANSSNNIKNKNELRCSDGGGSSSSSSSSSSDSNSSRKENVPPKEVMICIDMNMGGGGSSDCGVGSSSNRKNSASPPPFRKYPPEVAHDGDENANATESSSSPSLRMFHDGHHSSPTSDDMSAFIPKFDVDPDVPLETMAVLSGGSESSSDQYKFTTGLIIGDELLKAGGGGGIPGSGLDEIQQRKKERIMMQSLRRKQQAEENRMRKESENRLRREQEVKKEEEKQRKKEIEKARKEAILEQFKLKKEMEKADEEGTSYRLPEPVSARAVPRMRPKSATSKTSIAVSRQRPKTIHVDQESDITDSLLRSNRGNNTRGSSSNLSGLHRSESRNSILSNNDRRGGGGVSIASMGCNSNRISGNRSGSGVGVQRGPSRRSSVTYLNQDDQSAAGGSADDYPHGRLSSSGRQRHGSRESLHSGMTYSARRGSNASVYNNDNFYYGGSMRDLNNSGRPRKASSVSHLGPGSLPGYRRRGPGGEYDDGASDISSTSGFSAFGYRSTTRLYREPSSKSNRTIILNAIEYVVFPGVVNRDTRNRVLDVIDRCDCPHFLLLFRDAKCQFRGLYAYYPDTDEVYKIYGTGPKQVVSNMFEVFFKYNSGGKKFTKIHTKSLTVTIDAFTIHNALWLGKKSKLPDKRDMALVV